MKSIKDLTIEQVNAELVKLIDEKPDFVYAPADIMGACRYNEGIACTGCIFGQAFQRLGVPLESKELNSLLGVDQLWETTHGGDYSPRFWRLIQKGQDEGRSWGELKEYFPEELLEGGAQ